MKSPSVSAITDALSPFEQAVEVGIGTRTDVAESLAKTGTAVVATDIVPRAVPPDVEFALDDVTDPAYGVYEGADVIYGLNLPPELHRSADHVARRVDAAFFFTTLGGDEPAVPVTPQQVPGDTIYRVR